MQCTTEVNEKLIINFNMFSVRNKLWIPFAAMAFLLIIGIVVALDKDLGILGGVLIMGIGVLMPPFYLLFVNYLIKKNVKNSQMIKSKMVQTFRIEDKIYITETNIYTTNKDIEIAWEMILKATETEYAFYLYINKIQAFIIDKGGFTEGTPTELHDLLVLKLGAKHYKFPKKLYS